MRSRRSWLCWLSKCELVAAMAFGTLVGVFCVLSFTQRGHCGVAAELTAVVSLLLAQLLSIPPLFLLLRGLLLGVCLGWQTGGTSEQVVIQSSPPEVTTESTPADHTESAGNNTSVVDGNQRTKVWLCRVLRSRWFCALLCVLTAEILLMLRLRYYSGDEFYMQQLDTRWGLNDPAVDAPLWVGEFGTMRENIWWNRIIRYLTAHELDFAYWPFNGEKTNSTEDYYSILTRNSTGIRHPWKLEALQALAHYISRK